MNVIDPLDLRDRLVKALDTLDTEKQRAAAAHNTGTHMRLVGKYEGVQLAIGYLDEALGA